MKCEICGVTDFETIVLLGIKRPNGQLNTIACLSCAEKSDVYCHKHHRPHLGFDDDTTACVICIEEMISENKIRLDDLYGILITKLPLGEIEDLDIWAQDCSLITGNSKDICVLRVLATKALRVGISIDEVIEKIIDDQSVEFILPNLF